MTVPNVFQAIALVSKDVGAVSKAGDSGQGYKFRRVDDVINALHSPLGEHGVVIVPHVTDYASEPMERKNWTRTQLIVEYHVHGPAGDSLPTPVRAVGEAHNNSDKGPGVAMSYAYKTAMSQLFSLPTDDPTMDNEYTPPVETLLQASERTELAVLISAASDEVRSAMSDWMKSKQLSLKQPLTPEELSSVSEQYKNLAASLSRPGDAASLGDDEEGEPND